MDISPSPTHPHRLLNSTIQIKSSVAELSNLTGKITQVKRGGWCLTNNPAIVRPVREREFDVINVGEKKDGEYDFVEKEEASVDCDNIGKKAPTHPHRLLNSTIQIKSSVAELSNLTGKITQVKRGGWCLTNNPAIVRPVREREFDVINVGEKKDGEYDFVEKEEDGVDCDNIGKKAVNNWNHSISNGGNNSGDNCDPFFKVGTTIKITSGDHIGKICTISERRCGIFLKIGGDDVRFVQPDEVEVVEFANPPENNSSTNTGNNHHDDDDTNNKKKRPKDFGHEKYIGATVRIAVPGKRLRSKMKVESAFSGEWYLVSDPQIVKALDPDQFEVVEDFSSSGGLRDMGGGKRKRAAAERRTPLYSDSDEYSDHHVDDEEKDETDEFLSSMQYCGDAKQENLKVFSLRTRKKRIDYAEDEESSDDMESWNDGVEEEEEEEEEKEEEEEEDLGVDIDSNDKDDRAIANAESKLPATNQVVDVTKSSDHAEDNVDSVTIHEAGPLILLPKKVGGKMDLLLSGMSHLPPDTKIEVFNRKTGRVMRGDDAIPLKDLPAALLDHAEYEPVIPPPQALSEPDEGDTKTGEINAEKVDTESPRDPSFDPYDTSILIGVTVVIKSGPHKGLTGKIIEIQDRGRWLLDNKAITTTVRSSDCFFVDDGEVDKRAIAEHYQTKKKTQMPSFIQPTAAIQIGESYDASTPPSPPAVASSATVRRVGRTGRKVCVSNVVIPQAARSQTRVRASALEGKRVLVTGGEFRGLSGFITSCIPGGWYLISKLYNDNHDLDVLVHSEKLELIDDASSQMLPISTQRQSHEQIKSRIHLKASELRLSALNEKKQKVLKSAANHTDSRTKKHLEDIEREIKSLTAKIAAFRQDLASSS